MASGTPSIHSFLAYSATGLTAGTYYSAETTSSKLQNIDYQFAWANGGGGVDVTLRVQTSASNGVIWTDLPLSPGNPNITTASGNDVIQLKEVASSLIRVAVEVTTGPIDIDIYLCGKGI